VELIAYNKRSLENRTEAESIDYDLVEAKEKSIGENYYRAKRNEISLSWLDLDSAQLSGEKSYIWHASMPLPLWQCKEIYSAAKKMPKDVCRDLVFPDYELNQMETSLFDVIYSYGRAKGLDEVLTELFNGARAGDPRAVKMFLEVHDLLAEVKGDSLDKIIHFSFEG
jgi:hypothetical protein